MTFRRTRQHPAAWTLLRGEAKPSSVDADACCANCGRRTADAVVVDSLSVVARDGGRRLAPPMALCESCRRDVIYKRGWLPAWCTACQSWRRFGHHHEQLAPVQALRAEIGEADHLVQAD